MADNNTAVGVNSLGSVTSGTGNTTAGWNAGTTIAASTNNTLVGYGADISSDAVINAIAIGKDAVVAASGNLQLGSSSITNAKIGDGTATLNCVIDGGSA
jgi:hypothetical protein